MKLKALRLAGAALLVTVVAGPASAAPYLVQVLGLYNGTAPTTAESRPNAQFTLRFNLPDPFSYAVNSYGGHDTTAFTNSSFTIEGAAAGSGLNVVGFYSPATGYTPQVVFLFNDGSQLTLQNANVETNGRLASPSMTTGVTYTSPSGSPYVLSGMGTLTITNVTAVPEPATWAMMIAGFGLVGAGLRRRARVRATVRFA